MSGFQIAVGRQLNNLSQHSKRGSECRNSRLKSRMSQRPLSTIIWHSTRANNAGGNWRVILWQSVTSICLYCHIARQRQGSPLAVIVFLLTLPLSPSQLIVCRGWSRVVRALGAPPRSTPMPKHRTAHEVDSGRFSRESRAAAAEDGTPQMARERYFLGERCRVVGGWIATGGPTTRWTKARPRIRRQRYSVSDGDDESYGKEDDRRLSRRPQDGATCGCIGRDVLQLTAFIIDQPGGYVSIWQCRWWQSEINDLILLDRRNVAAVYGGPFPVSIQCVTCSAGDELFRWSWTKSSDRTVLTGYNSPWFDLSSVP